MTHSTIYWQLYLLSDHKYFLFILVFVEGISCDVFAFKWL